MTTIDQTLHAPAVAPDLRNAFGGIWRLTRWRAFSIGQWKFIGGFTIAMVLLMLSVTHHVRSGHFVGVTIEVYLLTILPTLAFLSGAALVREDLKPMSVDYLLSRPVPRSAFLVFRYLSHLACMQVLYLIVLGAILATGIYRGVPDVMSIAPRVLGAQVLTVTAFMALGFLFGAYTERYLVLGIAYASLIELAVGSIKLQINQISVLHHLKAMLYPVHRNFTPEVAPESALATTGFVVVFVVIMIALAAAIFSMRELVAGQAKEG
jgi:ABC-type transport system involved in multi-copper enzyme maturation permease subunit